MKTKSTKPAPSQDDNPLTLDALHEATADELYLSGYTFYRQGNYEEAVHFFRVMSTLTPQDPRGWMGLGATLQMLHAYAEAVEAYLMADLVQEEDDPRAPLHAAECFRSLNQHTAAKKALSAARQRAEKSANTKLLNKVEVFETMWNQGTAHAN